MTIGSRKRTTRSVRIVKYLDAPGGFYGRMDEPEEHEDVAGAWVGEEREQGRWDGRPTAGGTVAGGPGPGDHGGEGFDANDGVTEGDDGETLLRVKAVSRGGTGSKWSRRSFRRKPREALVGRGECPAPETMGPPPPSVEARGMEANEPMGTLIQFTYQGDADNQVLIRDKKRGREEEEEEEEEEGEEERRLRREQEGIKTLKRNTVKNYRKALDRAFRRGWEAFITNLYSVTLTPVTSAPTATLSPKSTGKKRQSSIALAEFK